MLAMRSENTWNGANISHPSDERVPGGGWEDDHWQDKTRFSYIRLNTVSTMIIEKKR